MSLPGTGLSLTWLLRLRWITAVGQTAAILVAERLLPEELSAAPLLGLVAFGALTNVALMRRLRRPEPVGAALPGLILGLDVLLLTGLLYGSGGAANPFTAIYLVHITLAAVVLRGLWAWALGALSLAGFGLLFIWNVHVHSLSHMNHGGGEGISLHLVGMWVAFAITAALIAAFVGRVTEALRQRDAELEALRDLTARQARLAALTTLAAGVAHELGTPLGTIAVAARELQRAAEGMGASALTLAQDAALIREEVGSCRRILDQMADPSATTPGENLQLVAWGELQAELLEGLPEPVRARVQVRCPASPAARLPRRGLVRAIRALLSNALDASPGLVTVTILELEGRWRVEVLDQGAGMPPEVLARAGEPFFSTKPTGTGMGLGLFLARTFAEQLTGNLQVESRLGEGTRVRLSWPQAPHA